MQLVEEFQRMTRISWRFSWWCVFMCMCVAVMHVCMWCVCVSVCVCMHVHTHEYVQVKVRRPLRVSSPKTASSSSSRTASDQDLKFAHSAMVAGQKTPGICQFFDVPKLRLQACTTASGFYYLCCGDPTQGSKMSKLSTKLSSQFWLFFCVLLHTDRSQLA